MTGSRSQDTSSLRRRVSIRTILALLLVSSAARAGRIDDYIRAEMNRRHIPGVSLAIVRDGRLIKQSQYGLANVEWKQPVTADTVFEIASMTKQFTVAGILLLAQDGKLSLDDPVSRYIDGTPDSWRGITLRHLMNHTSGLRDDWDEETPYFLQNDTNEKFVRALAAVPLKFSPGDGFRYSCGPFLLGMVIEKVTGVPYARFMRERVFAPLNMTHTFVNDASAIVPHRASGYVWRDGRLDAGARISPAAEARGDVGISTTTQDLVRWDAALAKPVFQAMFTPAILNDGNAVPYGLGWFIQPYRGHRLTHHPGGFRTGFNTVIERFIDDGLTIIILTNLQSGRARTLGYGVAAFFDHDFRAVRSVASEEPQPRHADEVRQLMAKIAAGTIAKQTFESLHIPASADEARDALHEVGPVTFVDRIVPRRKADIFGGTIEEVRFYEANNMIWSASFTSDGRLIFLDFED